MYVSFMINSLFDYNCGVLVNWECVELGFQGKF